MQTSHVGTLSDNANIYLSNVVKFDTEQLPPILNALETENGGQKLILEVAVSFILPEREVQPPSNYHSNIWVKMSFVPLPWTVRKASLEVDLPAIPGHRS